MDIQEILDGLRREDKNLVAHSKMFQIYEGNLNEYLDEWLEKQIDGNSIRYAKVRKCPINLLRKIVDKLSQIYQNQPVRTIQEPTGTNIDLLNYYEDSMKINTVMNISNEFFNMARSTLIQPYVYKGKPKLRAVPNDRFMVFSDDKYDPLNVTHLAICQGTERIQANGLHKQVFHLYTPDQFLIFDTTGEIRLDLMRQSGNEEGINPYGTIPFVYVNRSSTLLTPKPDLELMQMIILIAGLLTDLNFASMFSLFSVMYGIDVTDEQLRLSPNAFWNLKSDPASDKKPEIGTIKNDADVSETLELVKSQLAMFLNSRSIKTSSIGEIDSSNFASGISKLLDESDTNEERVRQISYFRAAEAELWDKIINNLHPVWYATNQIDKRLLFSPGAIVTTDFTIPEPMQKRIDKVRELKEELDAGFTTLDRAVRDLNPDMEESEILEILNNQNTIVVDSGSSTESQDQDTQGFQA